MAAKGTKLRDMSNGFLAQRLQSILINAAEGRRSVGDDRQYADLRREYLRRDVETPALIVTHPTTDSFSAYIKGIRSKPDRVLQIRSEFEGKLNVPDRVADESKSSESWTGIRSRSERVRVIKSLLPLAQAAIEGMIQSLSDTGGNGAPPLDEKTVAIENLRLLHRALGDLLSATDAGHLDDELGLGFAAEASRYAKRAAKALKHDPMPYVASGLLSGILTVCGLPNIGGFLGGIALNIRKNVTDRTPR